jgi:hypothetical protein
MSGEGIVPTPELEAAVLAGVYYDPRGGPVILEMLTGKVFETPPPQPTEEERQMAQTIVEELLKLHYDTLDWACQEVLGEGIDAPAFDIQDET